MIAIDNSVSITTYPSVGVRAWRMCLLRVFVRLPFHSYIISFWKAFIAIGCVQCQDTEAEGGVFTERDSRKDEAVVFIFIFATAGLLVWAAVKPWVGRWVKVSCPWGVEAVWGCG